MFNSYVAAPCVMLEPPPLSRRLTLSGLPLLSGDIGVGYHRAMK